MSHRDWKPLSGLTKTGVEVVLRRLHLDDVDDLGRWINQPEIRQLLSVDYPASYQQELDFIERATKRLDNPTEIPLAICAEGTLVGAAGLHDISLRHRHAIVGLFIGDKTWRGQGIGRTVYRLLIEFAFNELNLQALRADVYEHNHASQELHLRTGFTQVGCIPKWYFKAGQYQDFLTYHLSQETWRQQQP